MNNAAILNTALVFVLSVNLPQVNLDYLCNITPDSAYIDNANAQMHDRVLHNTIESVDIMCNTNNASIHSKRDLEKNKDAFEIANYIFGEIRPLREEEIKEYRKVLVDISKPTGRNLFDMV